MIATRTFVHSCTCIGTGKQCTELEVDEWSVGQWNHSRIMYRTKYYGQKSLLLSFFILDRN